LSVNKFMSVRKTLATPSVNLLKHGYEKHTYVETRRKAGREKVTNEIVGRTNGRSFCMNYHF
jgi:hypothetical protein